MAGRRKAARSLPAAALFGAGLVLALAATWNGRGPADAAEPFLNPGFETWSGASPASWTLSGNGLSRAAGEGNPGNAVRVTYIDGTPSIQHVAVSVEPGSSVAGSIEFTGSGVSVQIRLQYFNSGFGPVGTQNGSAGPAGPGWATATASGVAPAGAAFVQFAAVASGIQDGSALLDNATLSILAPEPTPTPTPSSTPTATAVPEETATPGPTFTPTQEPTSAPGSTATGTPTRTPSPTRTPTGTRTPSPTREATATKTPTPPHAPTAKATNPLPTSTPTLRAGSGFGGMLDNGDFELVSDGKPAYWEKFGGTMYADGTAARGSYAGCLESDTASTKWLYQVVPAAGGAWYAATASGRLVGGGAVSLRISWYASGDGSGSQLDQEESNVSSSSSWASLATGPIKAPAEALSARVRLVLRPEGPASGCWDDASFVASEAPAATPEPSVAPSASAGGPAQRGTATRPPATGTPRGGSTGPTGTPAPLAVFPAGGPGALRLSEVMSDPEPGGRDAAYEWVEVLNVSAEAVDLSGWAIGDSSERQQLPALEIPSLGYVVIAGDSAKFGNDVPVVRVPGGEIGNGLGNTGDYLVLIAPNGEIGDEISYGDTTKVFDPAPTAPGRGATIGVREPSADPASENWAETERPTPGEPNVFAPKANATGTAAAGGAAESAGAPTSGANGRAVLGEAGGQSPLAWIVLFGIASASGAVLLNRLGPRLHSAVRRQLGRWLP